MNTAELIEEVRHGLMEYQINPISNDYILSFLNRGYRKIYNHYARSSDNHFGKIHELVVNHGQQEYELPPKLWSKRLDYLRWPTPNNDARGYVSIEKIDYKDSHKYDLPAAFSTIPHAWAQLNNTIYFYPKPSVNVTAQLLHIPKLVPLRDTAAVILSFANPTITTVEAVSQDMTTLASDTVGNNFITICNGITGEIRHIFRFTAATGRTITIANPNLRSQVQGHDFSLTTDDLTDITQDDVICIGFGTAVPITEDTFNEFLINYAIIAIKSSLNENDVSLKEQLKDLMNEYKSDRVGRPGTETIERISRGPQYLGRYRSPR